MKAERLLSMLNLLIAEKKVSASELSRRLGVSVRTVYRDAEALCAAGFPLFATPGRDGGFELVEGFRMTGQTFSTGELRRVISALEGLSGICPEGELEALKRKFALLLTESGSRGVPCPEGSIFIRITSYNVCYTKLLRHVVVPEFPNISFLGATQHPG